MRLVASYAGLIRAHRPIRLGFLQLLFAVESGMGWLNRFVVVVAERTAHWIRKDELCVEEWVCVECVAVRPFFCSAMADAWALLLLVLWRGSCFVLGTGQEIRRDEFVIWQFSLLELRRLLPFHCHLACGDACACWIDPANGCGDDGRGDDGVVTICCADGSFLPLKKRKRCPRRCCGRPHSPMSSWPAWLESGEEADESAFSSARLPQRWHGTEELFRHATV